MNKIKIFVIYNKKYKLFKTDIYEPIQSGADISSLDLKILKDNTGNHISNKNIYYGELSVHYWVWKNYLLEHPELQYVGFCHYRKFFDFNNEPIFEKAFRKINKKIFINKFMNSNKDTELYDIIKNHDIIISAPGKLDKNPNLKVLDQWEKCNHPSSEIFAFEKILSKLHPEYLSEYKEFMAGNSMHIGTIYVMKKELFIKYMNWLFDLLFELEKQSNWDQYSGTYNERIPAFLSERFFNVWIKHENKQNTLRILERDSYSLYSKREFFFKLIKKTRKILYKVLSSAVIKTR
jgi:hypothetical protein